MFSQVIAVALCALVAQPAMATPCIRTYTVQKGDICDSISAAKNVSSYQLAVNNMDAINSGCTDLKPGSELCLGTIPSEDCQTTHVVDAGETCGTIASAAGINATILNSNNPQINSDCTNIYSGEVLCTAKTVQVPPLPKGAVPSTKSTPSPKSKPKPSPSPSPSPSPAPASDGSGEENLPWCDEL
jgi:LysM repeat protein